VTTGGPDALDKTHTRSGPASSGRLPIARAVRAKGLESPGNLATRLSAVKLIHLQGGEIAGLDWLPDVTGPAAGRAVRPLAIVDRDVRSQNDPTPRGSHLRVVDPTDEVDQRRHPIPL
jgi:hypothetical protein